ncbi:MAG: dihydroorotate dehydrogenase electron transfer subunit [Treponema sp.]|nr:dihydroorotate dehydrogenase electron transfer subunit [Treponema sp.]
MVKSIVCELKQNSPVTEEYFILEFIWDHAPPKAGQFFMVKPLRSVVFLPRPFGIFEYNAEQKTVKFLIAKKGKGTEELFRLQTGEKVQLTGPLGNCFADFLPETGKAALVGGSAGVAPLAALVAEKPDYQFYFYAGFKKGFREKEQENAILGSALKAKKVVVTAEDGGNAINGFITDYIFEPESYDVIFGCGPLGMMNALKKKCAAKNVPCFLSMESRFACGVGACNGCTLHLASGMKRCCKDGPVFPAGEINFNE